VVVVFQVQLIEVVVEVVLMNQLVILVDQVVKES
jgi:hypothetical protein